MNRRSGRAGNPWWRARPRAKVFRIPGSCAYKLQVRRLRVRVPCWERILERMKKVYGGLLNVFSVKASSYGMCPSPPERPSCISRSNSFYAEAIADCLEFIKRSYSPMEPRPSAEV